MGLQKSYANKFRNVGDLYLEWKCIEIVLLALIICCGDLRLLPIPLYYEFTKQDC